MITYDAKKHDPIISKTYKKWLDIGLSPKYSEKGIRRGIKWVYSFCGEKPPFVFILDSPMAVQLAANLVTQFVKGGEKNIDSQLRSQLRSQLDSQLSSQLRSQLGSQLDSQLYSQLSSQLSSQLDSQLDSQLGSQLRSQLGSQLGSQLRSQLDSQLSSQLRSQLRSQLDSQLRSQLSSQLSSQLDSQLDSQLYSQLSSQLSSQLNSQLDSQLYSQLSSQLSSQLDSQLDSQLSSQLRSQLDSQLRSQLRSQLGSQLRSQLVSQLGSQLVSQLRSQLDSQLYSQLVSQLYSQLDSQLRSQLNSQLVSQLVSQLRSQLRSQLDSQLVSQLRSQKKITKFTYLAWDKLFDAGFAAFYDAAEQIVGVRVKGFKNYVSYLRAGGCFAICFKGAVFVSRPPTQLLWDDRRRLHNEHGPAVLFADGYEMYAVHGTVFDKELFVKAYVDTSLLPKDVLSIKNTEQKAILTQHLGYDFIRKNTKSFVSLDSLEMSWNGTDKKIKYEVFEYEAAPNVTHRMIRVQWYEKGVLRETMLGVPREDSTKSCAGALAWTFDVTADNYLSALEIEA